MSKTTSTYDPYTAYEADRAVVQMALRRYVRQWKWFVGSIIVCLGLAFAYVYRQQPVYKIQASVLIKDEKKGVEEQSILKDEPSFVPSKVVENEIEILHSFRLMNKVVSKLNLGVTYFRKDAFKKKDLYGKSPIELIVEKPGELLYEDKIHLVFTSEQTVEIDEVSYPLNQSVSTPYGQLRIQTVRPVLPGTELYVQVTPLPYVVANYINTLTVEPTNKASTVVMLTLEDTVPERGEQILNELVQEYNLAVVADKNRLAQNALKFLDDRLASLSQELNQAEKGVESYKRTEGITDLNAQAQSFLQQVQQNDAQLNEVSIQLGALRDVERYVGSKANQRGVAPATMGLNDPVLLNLVTKLSDLEMQRDQLLRTTPEEHPLIETLDDQIRATRTGINENIQNNKQALQSTQSALVKTNNRTEGQIRTVPGKERTLLDITRQQAIKNSQYTYLLQKREETALSYAAEVSQNIMVDVAHSTPDPVKPKKLIIFLIFGLVGFVIPMGVLILRDMMNNQVQQRREIEGVTRVPVIGEIVKSREKQPLVVTPRTQSQIIEQFKMLRTDVQHIRVSPHMAQVVLVTSGISGEGKSFISMNLAASFALTNQPTILLEMDLRKPRAHKALNAESKPGISDYLAGRATLDDIMQPVTGYNYQYWVITSGMPVADPAELLAQAGLGQLFQELRRRFSHIVVDSPPISFFTDAKLLAYCADTSLLVVRKGVTPKAQLPILDKLQYERRFPNLHLVLNGFDNSLPYRYAYKTELPDTGQFLENETNNHG
ncbi:GumC family protein [Arsenicibacter rosenii]|uniref:Capsular biosynthesis protein n=1 Tax=Arsenicibacter rosenii TaxID=1750698 RepID=A0A1S2VGE9_9BACT|nr:GNVR domain-containing protein [Arsenicibacter rosenii]OIN57802.1 hypothetical protein BLX24_17020 [Arsenicibacter rosenii]